MWIVIMGTTKKAVDHEILKHYQNQDAILKSLQLTPWKAIKENGRTSNAVLAVRDTVLSPKVGSRAGVATPPAS